LKFSFDIIAIERNTQYLILY